MQNPVSLTGMKKIATILGARPQFIKAAPVSKAIRKSSDVCEVMVHTGQHFDKNMSQVFFDQMEIPRPDHHLNIHSLPHGAMTGRMIEGIEGILEKEQPDRVMVYGDTNSTLAGALAAVKLHIPVAHVEAGLRSYNRKMPEEINRILTDRISDLLFCPTPTAQQNLSAEGFDHFSCTTILSGDVMYDASLLFRDKARPPGHKALPVNFVLATIHREENTSPKDKLKQLIVALNEVSRDLPIVFPVHPRTQKLISAGNLPSLSKHVHVIDPVGYLEILYLLAQCQLVMTDSGGMQKEAYFFHKPCLTLRNETEWVELLGPGYNKLCGSDPAVILDAFHGFLNKPLVFADGLYGKGNASAIIAKAFQEH